VKSLQIPERIRERFLSEILSMYAEAKKLNESIKREIEGLVGEEK